MTEKKPAPKKPAPKKPAAPKKPEPPKDNFGGMYSGVQSQEES